MKKCKWMYSDTDDFYETECGEGHMFNEGNVFENKYKFCPYCGKQIRTDK